jgi:hypothetical protein
MNETCFIISSQRKLHIGAFFVFMAYDSNQRILYNYLVSNQRVFRQ